MELVKAETEEMRYTMKSGLQERIAIIMSEPESFVEQVPLLSLGKIVEQVVCDPTLKVAREVICESTRERVKGSYHKARKKDAHVFRGNSPYTRHSQFFRCCDGFIEARARLKTKKAEEGAHTYIIVGFSSSPERSDFTDEGFAFLFQSEEYQNIKRH